MATASDGGSSIADAVARAKAMAKEAGISEEKPEAKEPPVQLKGMCGWKINDTVMLQGLQSAAGQKLNGKIGVITSFVEDTNRFQVELAPGEVQSIKPENLRYTDKAPPAAKAPKKRSADSGGSSSSSDSSEKRRKKRAKKKRKQRAATFSNFTSFDQSGAGYTGKSREEMTAEEKLHEMMHGPMSINERDQYVRQRTAEAKKEEESKVKTKAAGALKVGDPVVIHGLQSESGKKLNGRSGVIAHFIESSGRFQVSLGGNEAPALKRENLKYHSDVPEWMRD